MRIGARYSHLNGEEYLLVHQQKLWEEVQSVIAGVEILPMKALEKEMSSGVPYYERDLLNVIRQGRGVPAVPLVLMGVLP